MRISDWSSDVCSSDLAAANDGAALYVPWRSQRIEFDDPAEHPSPLVESAAMAAVALPAPSYRPQLPKRVLDDKILSGAQLETIVHALAATDIDLTGQSRLPPNNARPSHRDRVCQYA